MKVQISSANSIIMSSTNNHNITLKGSCSTVSEYFGYSINSILYQRGLYDPATFTKVNKYGMQLQVTNDTALNNYLNRILKQLTSWLGAGAVQKLVLVITEPSTEETLERWVFNVQTSNADQNAAVTLKEDKLVQQEIGAILRQICSSVSFLPLLPEGCVFDLLIYTPDDCIVPELWEESDPRYIRSSNEVKLRSFSTNLHKVDTSVAYKMEDIF
jgi:mitotic spindle assembly checkpoint protein MAD2